VLGLPPGRSPSPPTRPRVSAALDATAFERASGRWLAARGVDPTGAPALAGKTLRGIRGDAVPGVRLVAAFAHRAGAVLAGAPSPGKGQEPAAVKAVLGEVDVAGRAVAGDARLTQRAPCPRIVAGGGHDPLPVAEDRPAPPAAIGAASSPPGRPRPGRGGAPGDRAAVGGRTGRARRGDGRGGRG
jgi:hypothetical protein